MMGKNASHNDINILNVVVKNLICKYKGSKTEVHLIYSKHEIEKTYDDEIIDLLDTLYDNNYKVIEKEEYFDKHSQIGTYFIKYVKDYFKNNP